MKFSYRLSKLCGSVHDGANVVFVTLPPQNVGEDGEEILFSAVGNRVSVFELTKHSSYTLPVECRSDITRMIVNNAGNLLVAIDDEGRAVVISILRRIGLHRFNFKGPVQDIKFSPDDKYLAVARGRQLQLWHAPCHNRDLTPFIVHNVLAGHSNDITSIDWSPCCRYLITGSLDNTCRVWSSQPEKKDGFVPVSLVGHKDNVIGCFFGEGGSVAYSIAKDCVVFVWKWVKDNTAVATDEVLAGGLDLNIKYGQWQLHSKHFLWEPPQASSGETGVRPKKKRKGKHGAKQIEDVDQEEVEEGKRQVSLKVRCAEFHKRSNLLAIGLSNGTFSLFEMDSVLGGLFTASNSSVLTPLHTLSISQADVRTVAINGSGEWLAFGASALGQLLVWEWQSESYILKQQGHSYDMNALAFSPDGSVIATGADDNKVKLWSTSSGFCYATFSDHTAPVTGVVFGPAAGRVVLTASLDGTVRAYDLLRYKNFRTLASPDPVQFSCLAIDSSGEVVVAGSMDPFHIYVWALQTGNLLDVLSGHEGPISSLAFDISSGHLASGSWDNTVKIWNVWNNECLDTLRHPASVLAIAYRPDGKQLTAATLHGQLHIWNPEEGDELGVIDGQRDIAGGRGLSDRQTSQTSAARRHFSAVSYSADGTCVLAAGRSRFVCIYETSQQILLKKFQVSHNRSRDGVLDKLDSRLLQNGSGVPIAMMNLENKEDEDEDPAGQQQLPGATRADDGKRLRGRREIVVSAVMFSPTGREWAAATSDGLLVYSLAEDLLFCPVGLEGEDVTPETTRQCIRHKDFSRALLMALQLGDISNEDNLLTDVIESIPKESLPLVVRSVTGGAVCRLIEALAPRLMASKHLEFYLTFSLEVLSAHGALLRPQSITARAAVQTTSSVTTQRLRAALRSLQKAIMRQQQVLLTLCDENHFTLKFLGQSQEGQQAEEREEEED